jgi:hypothetical protein
MKRFLAVAAFAAGVAAFTSAHADTINFGQFGPALTPVGNGAPGTTTGGVGFTITGPVNGFEVRIQDTGFWAGTFPSGTPLLYDEGLPGAVTIDFNTPLTSIDQIAVEANQYGPYVATMQIYDGVNLIGTESYSSVSQDAPGDMPSFSFSGQSFTSLVFSTTDDVQGLGLGGVGGEGGYTGSVPEPSAWIVMLIGFLGLGTMARMGRKAFATA